MSDEIYNYITGNIKMYNRPLDKNDADEIYRTYKEIHKDFNEAFLITHIESYHMNKNTKNRTQEEKDNVKNWRQARRASVCSENFFPNDYCSISYPKTKETFQFLSDILVKDVPFGFLTPKQKFKLIDTMKCIDVDENVVLIREGERDNRMYCVDEGIFDVYKNNVKLKSLKRGDYFGEIALLHNVERTATVISKVKSKIWVIEQKVFLGLRASDRNKNKAIILDGIVDLKLYPDLNEKELISFVNTLSFDYFKEGDVVNFNDDEVFMFLDDGEIEIQGGIQKVKGKEVIYNGFICKTVIEGSIMKKRQRKLYNLG
ncbi:hypothetical protein P3W45_000290 [Vairimorpha bombi]|jgi:cAMP-dependent protein kinase regulator